MNFILKNNQMKNGDIISPEIVYATFSDQLTSKTQKELVLNLNHGHEMLMIYKQYRDNFHIANVVEMLREMEEVFKKYDYEMYLLSR